MIQRTPEYAVDGGGMFPNFFSDPELARGMMPRTGHLDGRLTSDAFVALTLVARLAFSNAFRSVARFWRLATLFPTPFNQGARTEVSSRGSRWLLRAGEVVVWLFRP